MKSVVRIVWESTLKLGLQKIMLPNDNDPAAIFWRDVFKICQEFCKVRRNVWQRAVGIDLPRHLDLCFGSAKTPRR